MSDRFLSCDWGSSSFRLRLVEGFDIQCEMLSKQGATALVEGLPVKINEDRRSNVFASYLDRMLGKLEDKAGCSVDGLPIVVSGMATSAHGWKELPYADVPIVVDGEGLVFDRCVLKNDESSGNEIFLVSGVRTETDVMRGEECEIIGLMNAFDGENKNKGVRVIMPGTHSKHVIIREGMIADFSTYMTGELFDVFGQHSVLQHTTCSNASIRVESSAFREGVQLGYEEGLSRNLFKVRTSGLLTDCSEEANTAFMSGLLIGAELAALDSEEHTFPVILCAGNRLSDAYEQALLELEIAEVDIVSPEIVDGLSAIGHRVFLESRDTQI